MRIFRSQTKSVDVDDEEENFRALNVFQESVPQSTVAVRTFYQSGQVGQRNLTQIIVRYGAYLRLQCCDCISKREMLDEMQRNY